MAVDLLLQCGCFCGWSLDFLYISFIIIMFIITLYSISQG